MRNLNLTLNLNPKLNLNLTLNLKPNLCSKTVMLPKGFDEPGWR
jgi:hypothetical protein